MILCAVIVKFYRFAKAAVYGQLDAALTLEAAFTKKSIRFSPFRINMYLNTVHDIMDMYPHPMDNYCGADSTSTFVIGPEGNS